jgi:predicted DNA-binding transcriptional regulator AlpA
MRNGLRIDDIAKRLGLSRGRIYNIISLRRHDFPPPRMRIGSVKFWAREDVNLWLRTRVDGRTIEGRRRRKT